MRANPILFIATIAIAVWMTSCEKPIMPGISEDEITQEEIIGGWGNPEILCYLAHTESPIASILKGKMQENLEGRAEGTALYFTQDTAYFIERHKTGYYYVKAISAYQLLTNPMHIEMQNDHLMFNAYAPKLYVKKTGDKICFYLLKAEAMAMIEEDGSVAPYMSMIRSNIDDAQFEFYYQRNKLDIYQAIEGGDYIHSNWD